MTNSQILASLIALRDRLGYQIRVTEMEGLERAIGHYRRLTGTLTDKPKKAADGPA